MRTYKITNIRGYDRYLHVLDDSVIVVWHAMLENRYRSRVASRQEVAEYLRDVRSMSAYTVTRV